MKKKYYFYYDCESGLEFYNVTPEAEYSSNLQLIEIDEELVSKYHIMSKKFYDFQDKLLDICKKNCITKQK